MTPNYLMLFMAVFFIVIYLFIIAIVFSDNVMVNIEYKEMEKEDINNEGLE